MNRIIVSGSGGFIGQNLVPSLRSIGHEVWEIRRSVADSHRSQPNVVWFDGSLDSLVEQFYDVGADTVVHLASLFLASHKPTEVANLVRSNVEFGALLLESCVLSGTKNFINTGTAWQRYGGSEHRPVNLYAATKEAFECVLDYYEDTNSLSVVTIRLGDTYGPRDKRKKVVSLLVDSALSGEPLAMSPGEQQINLLHVDDVCDGFAHAIEYLNLNGPGRQRRFALRARENLSLRALAEMVTLVTGKVPNVQWGARPYRPREIFVPELETPGLPNWVPKIELQSGLRRLISEMVGTGKQESPSSASSHSRQAVQSDQ